MIMKIFITILFSTLSFNNFFEGNKLVESRRIPICDEMECEKNIIIGDSQTPYVDWGSSKFELISSQSGESSLWSGGKSLIWLLNAVKKQPSDSCVTNLAICIGTNGGFNKKDSIQSLIINIKNKFPNAKLFVIQGSWGWGGVSNKTEKQVRDYYQEFGKSGVVIVEPPIGKIEPHGRKPIYKTIGKNLDSLLEID